MKEKLILASNSPRRKELLQKITGDFAVVPSRFDESTIKEKDPVKFAVIAAEEKAKEVGMRHPDSVVIGADTIVVLDGKIFGKPGDKAEAKKMLKALSGKMHQVITGLAVHKKSEGHLLVVHETTDVVFKELSDAEIDCYISECIVLDKAGAYAIQDIGDKFVTRIRGDRDNVIGLPVARLREILQRFL